MLHSPIGRAHFHWLFTDHLKHTAHKNYLKNQKQYRRITNHKIWQNLWDLIAGFQRHNKQTIYNKQNRFSKNPGASPPGPSSSPPGYLWGSGPVFLVWSCRWGWLSSWRPDTTVWRALVRNPTPDRADCTEPPSGWARGTDRPGCDRARGGGTGKGCSACPRSIASVYRSSTRPVREHENSCCDGNVISEIWHIEKFPWRRIRGVRYWDDWDFDDNDN